MGGGLVTRDIVAILYSKHRPLAAAPGATDILISTYIITYSLDSRVSGENERT